MKIEYRQARIIAATEGRNFNGYAVRWDDVTAPLAELRGYKEKIKRGALRFDANTALFMGHAYENQVPLARVGSGTMEVEEDKPRACVSLGTSGLGDCSAGKFGARRFGRRSVHWFCC